MNITISKKVLEKAHPCNWRAFNESPDRDGDVITTTDEKFAKLEPKAFVWCAKKGLIPVTVSDAKALVKKVSKE